MRMANLRVPDEHASACERLCPPPRISREPAVELIPPLLADALHRSGVHGAGATYLHIRITHSAVGRIDGIRLDLFEPGRIYNVNPTLGCYLISIGSATLDGIADVSSAAVPSGGIDHLDRRHDVNTADPRAEAAERSSRKRRRGRKKSI